MEEQKTRIFPVKGMTCASCAASVESMLKNTGGVADASVDILLTVPSGEGAVFS
ncbi:MAG: heavy metal-associated domain-containing protein [Bacteroidales bacterium]|nr:heavy metal-associated domain-containing protein [Bacteroidales bacterium]